MKHFSRVAHGAPGSQFRVNYRRFVFWAKPAASPTSITVHKFGGSSVGSADAFRAVLGGILVPYMRSRRKPVAVLSAMLGVTNRLIDSATAASQGRFSTVRELRGFLRSMHMATLDGALAGMCADTGTSIWCFNLRLVCRPRSRSQCPYDCCTSN